MKTTWRDRARPVIRRVLEQTRGQSDAEIRKALRDAYPFGPRCYHPYKAWRDEIKVQRGQKPPTGARSNEAQGVSAAAEREALEAAGQQTLFGGGS